MIRLRLSNPHRTVKIRLMRTHYSVKCDYHLLAGDPLTLSLYKNNPLEPLTESSDTNTSFISYSMRVVTKSSAVQTSLEEKEKNSHVFIQGVPTPLLAFTSASIRSLVYSAGKTKLWVDWRNALYLYLCLQRLNVTVCQVTGSHVYYESLSEWYNASG